MRTFSRAEWEAALSEWEAGDFSAEWKPWRHRAAMRGMIHPPEGTKWDSWEDDSPSQRAVLIRAIRETPKLLGECIDRARSWYEVITLVERQRDDWRSDAIREERAVVRDKENEPTHRQAVMALASVLQRIDDSR